MRWRIAKSIFLKEMLETVRDRRTLVVMLVLPILLYPVMLVGVMQIVSHQVSTLSETMGKIVVVGEVPELMKEHLTADKEKEPQERLNLELIELKSTPPPPPDLQVAEKHFDKVGANDVFSEDALVELGDLYVSWARQKLQAREADVVIVFSESAADSLSNDRSTTTAVLYDRTIAESNAVWHRVHQLLHDMRVEIMSHRLGVHDELQKGFTRPIIITARNTAPPQKQGGYYAGRIIPSILIIMILLGAFYPAVDITSGEKERGTMQTLMTAPAESLEIIIGKFMSVFVVAMFSALANLVSMGLAFLWLVKNNPMEENLAFHISLGSATLLFVQIIPIALLFSGVMLAIAVFAHSYKEAQNYLTPVYMLVLIPVMLTGLPSIKLVGLSTYVPVLNVMLLMRDLLSEPPSAEAMTTVLVSNFVYAVAALLIAARVFRSEQVLLGGAGAFSDVFRIRPADPDSKGLATANMSVTAFCLILVLLFYVGSVVQRWDIVWGMVITQWGLLLLPVMLLVKIGGLDMKETLMLRMPSPRSLLAALVVGCSVWLVLGTAATLLQNAILPAPPSFDREMQRAFGQTDLEMTALVTILVFSLSPGICEEVLFRGLILSGFRNTLRKWPAILLTAAMFGVFHISIYRIMPTAIVGIAVTYVVWQTRSIWCGVIVHALNNGIALLVTKYKPGWIEGVVGVGEHSPNIPVLAAFTIALVAGFAMLPKDGAEDREPQMHADSRA